MQNKSYLKNVTLTKKPHIFPERTFNKEDELITALENKRLSKIKINETLKGGTVSQVYGAELNNKRCVIKHTEDVRPFDPTEIFIAKNGHNVDTRVLQLLKKSSVRVPKVFHFFPGITTTVMEDMREGSYELLSNQILDKRLTINSAHSVGIKLAELAQISRDWSRFETNETAQESIYERGLELRLLYPNTQEQYLKLEKEHCENDQYWTWPDGHPKNIFVNKNGEVAFIDFGRSYWGDQRYMLPNFLSHIAIYSLIGYINRQDAVAYMKESLKTYQLLESVNPSLFCQYFGMEILHRAFGKWIQGVTTTKQKISLTSFGLTIFDKKISKLEGLFDELRITA